MTTDSKASVKKIESLMNDKIVSSGSEDKLVFNNLNIFYELCQMILSSFAEAKINDCDCFDISKFHKTSFIEDNNLVQAFYQKHNINFDFNKIISNGTLEYKYIDEPSFEDNNGVNGYRHHHPYVNVNNNGIISDAVILVHELSHYRNQPESGRSETNDLLTEAIAFAEELIFINYLDNLGYKYEMTYCNKDLIVSAKECAMHSINLYKMLDLYRVFGNLNKDNYKLYYQDDTNYDNDLNALKVTVRNRRYNIYKYAEYVLGYSLGIYMYMEYRKNNTFINNIENLHTQISTDDINDVLAGLNLNGNNIIEKISAAIIQFKDEIYGNDKKL
jgi:hypothetical protein